jgi:hypothetical protein
VTPAAVLTGVLVVLALLWKVRQLLDARTDWPLRAMTACLGCGAASHVLGVPVIRRWVDAHVAVGTGSLLQNLLLLVVVYLLLCFYIHSETPALDRAVSRIRWEAVPLALALILLTVTMYATPQAVRGRGYRVADLRVGQVALFYAVAGCYLVYGLGAALRWTVRYARLSRRPLSTGLWLTAGSLAGMVIACLQRLGFTAAAWRGAAVPRPLVLAAAATLGVAVPLFAVGISYPVVAMRLAACRLWWRHRRDFHRLAPLWTVLHQAFPQDALEGVEPSGGSVHRRYYRRVIECRDGLVRISPYLSCPASHPRPSSSAVAADLCGALAAYRAGAAPRSATVGVALPEAAGLDADVEQLVALADALAAGPAQLSHERGGRPNTPSPSKLRRAA